MKRFIFLLALTASCGGGLSEDDKQSLRHAAILSEMAYAHEDASTPAAALMRGAFCSDDAVMRRQGLARIDAGIACEMSP